MSIENQIQELKNAVKEHRREYIRLRDRAEEFRIKADARFKAMKETQFRLLALEKKQS